MDDPRHTRVIGILVPDSIDAEPATLIRDGMRLHRDGAEMVDIDTMPRGPFADIATDRLAFLIRGLGEAGIAVSVTTTRAAIAAIAVERGAHWIIDPSGMSADPEMRAVARRPSSIGWAIGPWSTRSEPAEGLATVADAYTYGLVRNIAELLGAGVDSDRIVLNASAGLSSASTDLWRMLDHLDRVRGLGYPVLIDAREELLASISTDDSARQRDDAAVGLAVLAAGARAWGIRTRAVARAADAVGRILAPRVSA